MCVWGGGGVEKEGSGADDCNRRIAIMKLLTWLAMLMMTYLLTWRPHEACKTKLTYSCFLSG